jgi:hypothetical protein
VLPILYPPNHRLLGGRDPVAEEDVVLEAERLRVRQRDSRHRGVAGQRGHDSHVAVRRPSARGANQAAS